MKTAKNTKIKIDRRIYSIASMLCLVAFLFNSFVFADIYSWVDENGKIHFSDKRSAPENAELVEFDEPNIADEVKIVKPPQDPEISNRDQAIKQKPPKLSEKEIAVQWANQNCIKEKFLNGRRGAYGCDAIELYILVCKTEATGGLKKFFKDELPDFSTPYWVDQGCGVTYPKDLPKRSKIYYDFIHYDGQIVIGF